MNFDYDLLGRKLKEARESLLINIEEVADYLNCTNKEYIDIENGTSNNVDGDTIILLSQLYERDFRYFITGNYTSAESQIIELFRQNNNLSKNDRISIQRFIRLCEDKYNLELLLNKTKVNPINYNKKIFSSQIQKKQGIEAACLERNRLGIRDSINDLYSLLRKQNIHIFRRKLEDNNISGVYIKHPIAGHCVLINYSDDIYRQNFSMAHEYCHVIFDSEKEQNVSYFKQNNNYIELRANNFASNFLVPKEALINFKNFNDINLLKEKVLHLCYKYHVSSQVILNRLKQEKYIDIQRYNLLISDKELVIPKNGKEDPELKGVSINMYDKVRNLIENGISIEFVELCRTAYQQNEITYGRMVECINLPFEKSKELFDSWDILMEVE